MRLHRFAIALSVLCFALLLLGGHVHNTGSSLACGTDWPRCNGTWVPEMKGGVLFEHSHRILAAVVGLGAVVLAVWLAIVDWRRGARDASWIALSVIGLVIAQVAGLVIFGSTGAHHGQAAPGDVPVLFSGLAAVGMVAFGSAVALAFRRGASVLGWALLAVGLVAAQGLLGALTVAVGLSPAISTAHLGTSMLFFAALLVVAVRTRPHGIEQSPATTSSGARRLVMITLALLYAQMLLGAVVRHLGAGMYCGVEFPLCHGVLWPSGTGVHVGIYLHILHRALGVIVMCMGFAVGRSVWRATGDATARRVALAIPLLLVAQVTLGAAAVLTILNPGIVTAHLGVAAALFAALIWLLVATGAGAARPGGVA